MPREIFLCGFILVDDTVDDLQFRTVPCQSCKILLGFRAMRATLAYENFKNPCFGKRLLQRV